MPIYDTESNLAIIEGSVLVRAFLILLIFLVYTLSLSRKVSYWTMNMTGLQINQAKGALNTSCSYLEVLYPVK
jgi:hypothetical protein